MTVESIQRVYSITPLYTQQEVIRTIRDPKTDKEQREFIVYRVYNPAGQIEERYQPKIDLQA